MATLRYWPLQIPINFVVLDWETQDFFKDLDRSQLSQREMEVLKLIVSGKSNQEIANTLQIAVSTAKTHVRKILETLDAKDRTQAAVKAIHLLEQHA